MNSGKKVVVMHVGRAARRRGQVQGGEVSVKPSFDAGTQPDDYVYDPRYVMEVSRQGRDRGAVKRDLVQDMVDVGGSAHTVNRVRDSLQRMWDRGTINDDMLHWARHFQSQFDRAGYDRVSTTNLTGSSGGGLTKEDILAITQDARNYCADVREMLGGASSPMWLAVSQILGHRIGYERLVKQEGENAHFWRGILQASFHLMVIEHRKSKAYRRDHYTHEK